MVPNCAPENLEIPGLVLTHHPGMTKKMDCFAEPVIGRAFARPFPN